MRGENTKNESCIFYERYENTPSFTAQKLYYYPQWAGHFICNPDFYIERFNWPDILIIRTTSGSGKLYYRDKEYVLDKDNFAMINCMDKCMYYPNSQENWAFSFLHFTGAQSTEIYEHIYNLNDGCVFENNQKIDKNIEECIALCKEKGTKYEVHNSKKISNILHEILLTMQRDESDKISMVCDYIAENYSENLSTEKLAKCDVLPIGDKPSGKSFTGFYISDKDKPQYLLLSREPLAEKNNIIKLPVRSADSEILASNTDADVKIENGLLYANIETPRSYVFVKLN